MVLVGYSDSEGSETESTPVPTTKPVQPAKSSTTTNFAVDKSNPKKIRVNLTEAPATVASTDNNDGEPPTKRARVGAGAFSGFNAMLPAPKRDNLSTNSPSANTNGTRAPARKVFSLKTGAEPAFSRDSDSELRELFADDGPRQTEDSTSTIPASIPKPTFPTDKQETTAAGSEAAKGKPFMFKPLSVARNTKKKKSASTLPAPAAATARADQTSIPPGGLPASQEPPDQQEPAMAPAPKKQKISLFSSGPAALPPDSDDLAADDGRDPDPADEDEIVEFLEDDPQYPSNTTNVASTSNQPESLDSIATSLNLSAAERRQLLGRNHGSNSSKNMNPTAGRVINFNTDAEYIANQQLNAAGEQAAFQHNPVRAIAPGKHSLKSLVASAQGQKDALEESFASGKKNKREAGSKYGW